MKKSKFTKAQIIFVIKQFEIETGVDEISRQIGNSKLPSSTVGFSAIIVKNKAFLAQKFTI